MRFFCPGCGTKYTKPDDEIPAEGLSIPCEKCGFSISLKAPRKKTLSSAPEAGRASRPAEPGTKAKTSDRQPATSPADSKAREDATEKIDTLDPDEVDELPAEEPRPEPEPEAEAEPEAEPEAEAATSGGAPGSKTTTRAASKTRTGKRTRKESRGRMRLYSDTLGTGRSGDAFRVRDLLYALVVPLDLRKLLVVGAAVFTGSFVMTGLTYLGVLAKSQVAATIGLIIGIVVFAALDLLALGVTSHLTDQEMEAGKHLPLSVGTGFVKSNWASVLGIPFVLLVGMLIMGVGIALLGVLGRIPYAGPLLYGLTFGVSFALSLTGVLLGVLLVLVAFSYVPAVAREKLGPVQGARRMAALLKSRPGRYLLHVAIAGVCAFVLVVVLDFLVGLAMTQLAWIDSRAMGADLTKVFMAMPLGLFAVAVLMLPETVGAVFQTGADVGWQFDIAGWLVLIVLVAVGSLMAAFIQVYFFGAGVVNYHLLGKKK